MRVLITGATGFLGSHLARALLQRGDTVLAYKRASSSLDRLGPDGNRIEWFDLSQTSIDAPFENGKIDAVVHAATFYNRANVLDLALLEANLVFPLRVYKAAEQSHCPLFLNLHTFFPRGINSYGMAKHQLIDWLNLTASETKIVHVKLEHLYGPKDNSDKFVEWLLRRLQGEGNLPLTGGEQRRDFIYITDAVQGILCMLDHATSLSQSPVLLGLGTGQTISLKEFVMLCHQLSQSKTALKFGALPYRPEEPMESKADISQLQQWGWTAETGLEEGIRKSMEALPGKAAQ